MEDAFRKLERDGHNSVDNLVAWMKDCKCCVATAWTQCSLFLHKVHATVLQSFFPYIVRLTSGLRGHCALAKIIDNHEAAIQKTKALFQDVQDKNRVEYKKFEQVLRKISIQTKTSLASLSNDLAEHSERIHSALADASRAAREAFEKAMR